MGEATCARIYLKLNAERDFTSAEKVRSHGFTSGGSFRYAFLIKLVVFGIVVVASFDDL
jgi:hypothetical protein